MTKNQMNVFKEARAGEMRSAQGKLFRRGVMSFPFSISWQAAKPATPSHKKVKAHKVLGLERHKGWQETAKMVMATKRSTAVGFITGPSRQEGKRGVIVIDVDAVGEKMDRWHYLSEEWGLETTYTVKSPHGLHLYYFYREGTGLTNSTKFNKKALGVDVDVRTTGGFIIGAGSWYVCPDLPGGAAFYVAQTKVSTMKELPQILVDNLLGRVSVPVVLTPVPVPVNETDVADAAFWEELGFSDSEEEEGQVVPLALPEPPVVVDADGESFRRYEKGPDLSHAEILSLFSRLSDDRFEDRTQWFSVLSCMKCLQIPYNEVDEIMQTSAGDYDDVENLRNWESVKVDDSHFIGIGSLKTWVREDSMVVVPVQAEEVRGLEPFDVEQLFDPEPLRAYIARLSETIEDKAVLHATIVDLVLNFVYHNFATFGGQGSLYYVKRYDGDLKRVIWAEERKVEYDHLLRISKIYMEGRTVSCFDIVRDYTIGFKYFRKLWKKEFSPPPGVEPRLDTMYLFVGWKFNVREVYDHAAGEIFEEHILRAWADGNQVMCDYVLSWMANIIQTPGKRNNTALVVNGEPGTGKSIVTNLLREAMGFRYVLSISNSKLVKTFNDTMANVPLVVFEEADLTDPVTAAVLKSNITDNTMQTEAKFQSILVGPNVLNAIITSNFDVPVRIEPGDRRYAVMRSKRLYSAGTQEKSAYFNRLGGIDPNDLFQFLMHRDISEFIPTAYHSTEERSAMLAAANEKQVFVMATWIEGLIRFNVEGRGYSDDFESGTMGTNPFYDAESGILRLTKAEIKDHLERLFKANDKSRRIGRRKLDLWFNELKRLGGMGKTALRLSDFSGQASLRRRHEINLLALEKSFVLRYGTEEEGIEPFIYQVEGEVSLAGVLAHPSV